MNLEVPLAQDHILNNQQDGVGGNRQLSPSGRSSPQYALKCQICDHSRLEELGMEDSEVGSSPWLLLGVLGVIKALPVTANRATRREDSRSPGTPTHRLGLGDPSPSHPRAPGPATEPIGTQCRMKMQTPCPKLIKNFKTASAKPLNQTRGP